MHDHIAGINGYMGLVDTAAMLLATEKQSCFTMWNSLYPTAHLAGPFGRLSNEWTSIARHPSFVWRNRQVRPDFTCRFTQTNTKFLLLEYHKDI